MRDSTRRIPAFRIRKSRNDILIGMHDITDAISVGNLEEAKRLPRSFGGVLFYDISPPDVPVYQKIPFREFTEAEPGTLKSAVEWIEGHVRSYRVLVCCRAGMGRSVSVVVAYLTLVMGLSYTEALLLLKTARPGATPLPQLEKTIQQVQAMRAGQ